MSEFNLNSDDVVSINEPSESLLGNRTPTFRVDQLENAIRQLIMSNNSIAILQSWVQGGINCQFLSASTGKGWKKGKIRIRFEFVADEPEPSPDESFLNSLRTGDYSQEQDVSEVE